jgi:tetratricopeptide (TPR) repeat protein
MWNAIPWHSTWFQAPDMSAGEPNRSDLEGLVHLYRAGRFGDAEARAYELAAKGPPSHLLQNILGVILSAQAKHQAALECYQRAVQLKADYPVVHNNLGSAYAALEQLSGAEASFRRAVALEPAFAEAHGNLGNVLRDLGKRDEAVASYRRAIALSPGAASMHVSLAGVLLDLGRPDEAVAACRHALQLTSDLPPAHDHLGDALRKLGDLADAAAHYQKANAPHARAKALECLLACGDVAGFDALLAAVSRSDPPSSHVAAISAFAAHEQKRDNTYSFARAPLELIGVRNVAARLEPFAAFAQNVIAEAASGAALWEPPRTSTKRGYQTQGNLFALGKPGLAALEAVIRSEISAYFDERGPIDDAFITRRPARTHLTGWHVKLMSSGHQEAHMHPGGWLSGVLYLKLPRGLTGDEGAIRFGLHGYNYRRLTADGPSRIHHPKEGDLLLFPSSLFHQTIPFSATEERHSLAFDLEPLP